MDLFERQWSSYRAIVEHNLMEHRQVADATAAALEGWLAQRPAQARAPRMVDLGCGDLALLAPLLQRLPLGSYTGVDLAAVALPLAQRTLGPVPYPSQWLEVNLLAWATADLAADVLTDDLADSRAPGKTEGRTEATVASPVSGQSPLTVDSQGRTVGAVAAESDGTADGGGGGDHGANSVDILHSAFAIHHLTDGQKAAFLRGARQRISADGVFVWVDVFREPGESRQAFLQRYGERVCSDWRQLTAEQEQHVIDHLSRFDIPAERTAIEATAAAAGWHWRWGWQGAHRAEALAVLTPA